MREKMNVFSIHGWNYRGFREVEVDLTRVNFIVGDNSSGKSSILHLLSLVVRSDLDGVPSFDEELGIDRYDYFSPYFNDAPVSLGYRKSIKGSIYSKIITINKSGDSVYVSSATFYTARHAYSLKANGKKLLFKMKKFSEETSMSELYNFHSAGGFKTLKLEVERFSAPNDFFSLILAFESLKPLELERDFYAFYAIDLERVVHLAPIRGLPEKYYLLKRTIHASGRHFAALWHDFDKPSSKQYFAKLSDFGKKSGLFERVRVFRLDRKIKDSPLAVTVRKNGKDLFLNQVGVGVSQLMPILIELIVAQLQKKNDAPSSLILMQQPELHLHPIAQAELGTYLYDVATAKIPMVLETHSSYLIDRFRSEMRGAPERVSAALLFCFSDGSGNSCVTTKIKDDGEYNSPPSAYLQFFLSESLRTII
jgi:predicted ATPase